MFEIVDEVVDFSVRTPRSCRSGIALFHSVATHLRCGGMLSVSLLLFVANLRASQSRKNLENRLIFEERYGQDFSGFLFTVWKAFSIYTVSAKHRSTYMICFANVYFIVL